MEIVGKACTLIHPIRTHEGIIKSKDHTATIIRAVENLGRLMYLVKFEDKSTTFLFPDEIEITE